MMDMSVNREVTFLAILLLAAALAAAVLTGTLPIVLVGLFISLMIFSWRLDWGAYVLVALSPFTGLILDFSQYEFSRTIPFIRAIDAPWVDFFAMFLLAAVFVRLIVDWARGVRDGKATQGANYKIIFPGLVWYAPFFLSAVVSLRSTASEFFGTSVKFIIRPILFFYLMFVSLPMMIIRTRTVAVNCLRVMYTTGLLGALMGLASFFVVGGAGLWRRATPFYFFGFAPFGYNHNLLAEALVAAAPIGMWFARSAKDEIRRRWYFFGTFLIVLIALLTFARTAWIALAVQGIIYWLTVPHGRLTADLRKKIALAVVVLGVPFFMYMAAFSMSYIAAGSTSTRADLTRIAITYFKRSPWIGVGAGTFLPIVAETRAYFLDYGDPLDAHGVVQKLIAEQGLFGLVAFFIFVGWVISELVRTMEKTRGHVFWSGLLPFLLMSVASGFVYQLFNTSYYNSKLWIPVGVALAISMLARKETRGYE
ncbi:MAG: rane protein [Candidatus Magasanikbacteria bacterium]|nr:rane protein [Candidatus Magasanikbacteria bacterium]